MAQWVIPKSKSPYFRLYLILILTPIWNDIRVAVCLKLNSLSLFLLIPLCKVLIFLNFIISYGQNPGWHFTLSYSLMYPTHPPSCCYLLLGLYPILWLSNRHYGLVSGFPVSSLPKVFHPIARWVPWKYVPIITPLFKKFVLFTFYNKSKPLSLNKTVYFKFSLSLNPSKWHSKLTSSLHLLYPGFVVDKKSYAAILCQCVYKITWTWTRMALNGK